MTDCSPTFKKWFSEIFKDLEDCGCEPQWQPMASKRTWPPARPRRGWLWSWSPPEDGRAEMIRCGSGPIKTVTLVWRSFDTDRANEGTANWQTYTEVCFQTRADWANRWIPGLHLLSIHLKIKEWAGNDLGLGIIHRLNGALPTAASLKSNKIRVKPPYNYYGSPDKRLDIHHVADHAIEIVGPENSTVQYDKAETQRASLLASSWQIPQPSTILGLISVAQVIVEEPPNLPPRIEQPEVSVVPAPRINHLSWTGYLLLTLLLLGGGLTSIFWDWPGRHLGWMLFLGIVLSLISFYFSVKTYHRFFEVRSGLTKLFGTLDRKWVSPDHGYFEFSLSASFSTDKYALYDALSEDEIMNFIRVEGLPFKVKQEQYRELSEGDAVTIMYWPKDKRVEALMRETSSNAFE